MHEPGNATKRETLMARPPAAKLRPRHAALPFLLGVVLVLGNTACDDA